MEAKPKRRWYQVSLRTMFVGMTVACVSFGYWVLKSQEWIRQRHEAKEVLFVPTQDAEPCRAPGGLWLLGEKGIPVIWVMHPSHLERTKALFPESQVIANY